MWGFNTQTANVAPAIVKHQLFSNSEKQHVNFELVGLFLENTKCLHTCTLCPLGTHTDIYGIAACCCAYPLYTTTLSHT